MSGREASPTAGIIDSQSVKTTEAEGPRGFDAGKKVNGRKQHLLTDTLGLPLRLARSAVLVTGMLTGGMALAAGIDLWSARDATTLYQLSLFAFLEEELEAYTALGALLGWAALCIAPTIQVERHRRAATNTYPMYP